MKRREFITLVGGTIAGWPLAARGQQLERMPTIGFLGTGNAQVWKTWVAAFVQRLRELGWIEGRTVTIDFRWAQGQSDRYTAIATEFARQKVDVIVTSGVAVGAVRQETSVIPIVFAVAEDPLGTGLVTSLARPGGNVTGLSSLAVNLGGKRLELLREVVPALRRLAIMGTVGYPASVLEMAEVQTAARTLGLEVAVFELQREADIALAFEALNGRVEALYLCTDPLIDSNRGRINTLARLARLPTMHGVRDLAEAAGLLSYGASFPDLFRRAGDHVDKILRGTKPADIPVEQPTKFELVINLKTAKELGLTISPMLLARADEVIE
jgi:putative ABC transport system substrate-binding protein